MHKLWTLPAFALVVGLALPAGAKPPPATPVDLHVLIQKLGQDSALDRVQNDPAATTATADRIRLGANELRRAVGPMGAGGPLPQPAPFTQTIPLPDSPLAKTQPGSLTFTALQFILGQLAVQTGANGHLTLMQAQAAGPAQALILRGGTWDLADILAALPKDKHAALQYTQGQWTLTRPLVIWAGTHLILAPGDDLNLAPQTGAFLLNFGKLSVRSATVQASGLPNRQTPLFHPFILTTAAGQIDADHSRFSNLGMNNAPGFEGISAFSNPVFPASTPHRFLHNQFRQGTSVHLSQTGDSQITGNLFIAARSTALRLSGTRGTTLTNNLFHSTHHGAALRLTAASRGVKVQGNILLNGANGGLRLDRGAGRAQITGNLFLGHHGAGLVIVNSDCNQIAGNIFAANHGPGLTVHNSQKTAIWANGFLFNKGAGLWLHGQSENAVTQTMGNLFSGNTSGITGADTGDLRLSGNDLTHQLPRKFAGDLALARQTPHATRSPLPCLQTGDS